VIKAGSEKETRTAEFGQTVLEPFLVFLRLGLTSFGGPIAHLGYFRHEFVESRCWLTEQTFADLVALCNFLPGPTSSQVLLLDRYDARRHSRCHFRLDRVYAPVGDYYVVSCLRHSLG
jgi:hypothetical protein